MISLNVLAREPTVGLAKTRLIPVLGPEGAARAYEQLLTHVMRVACEWSALGDDRVVNLWCTPDIRHPFFDTLLPIARRFRQADGDLGARMHHIVVTALRSCRSVLLLGSDVASVDAALLDQAVEALRHTPVVMAAAEDGGYALLGLSRPAPELFSFMPWGTEGVAEETRRRLNNLRWRWWELPMQWDVDRPDDWHRFVAMVEKKAVMPVC